MPSYGVANPNPNPCHQIFLHPCRAVEQARDSAVVGGGTLGYLASKPGQRP